MNHQVANPKIAPYGRIFHHDNGIIYIHVIDNASIDLPEAIQIIEDIRALDNSGKARLLVVQGSGNDMSFAAQTHLGKANAVSHFALVVQSRLQAEAANFFVRLIKMFRATYEMRIFHALIQAERWLLTQPRA